ncbi:MAG TPA: chemotaxis protein CheA [Longimicrobiales bacterium]|nr:chemotaxis protein CheA [Longimicrobiales bacterium]
MDLRRFLDLYISESEEHVRLLHRSLLSLEGDGGAAVDEAFRAAHTLKGLSAAMGYAEVADLAHHLEDCLDGVRAGRIGVDAALIDRLLGEADAVEAAIARAVTTAPSSGDDADAGASPGDVVHSGAAAVAAPDGTATIARVRLRPDAPIKAARAMLIMRSLADMPGVIGSDPASFDDDFDGAFRIFLSHAADAGAVASIVERGGEVDSVDLVAPEQARAPAAAVRQAEPSAAKIRVDAGRLDELAEGIAELSVLHGRLPAGLPPGVTEMLDRMGVLLGGLQHDVLSLRMVPLREAFDRLPRVVRDAARTLGRDVELVIEGEDVELDRAILEEIGDPLVHLLRNSVDHGLEDAADREAAGKPPRGRIRVSAQRERSSVRITVEDDGRGVPSARVVAKAKAAGLLAADAPDDVSDEELFRLMSHAGLSTAEQVTSVSGRGVGMDVVVSRVRALGGAIDMRTVPGAGTTFGIRLPVTLALAQALRVRVGGEDYAIPLTHLSEAIAIDDHVDADAATITVRDVAVPLVRMRRMLQVTSAGSERAAVIAEMGGRRAALAVDELVGREQILVKSFDPVAGMLPYFSGATLLADGRPALVLDPLSVM